MKARSYRQVGVVVLDLGRRGSLSLRRMPLGWLFVMFDASGVACMLAVPDDELPALRGFCQDAAAEVD